MKFIHFTDPHLVPRGELLHGLNSHERLEACIDDINRHHGDAELCVVTGDLAHHAQPGAYADLRECLSRLRMPTHLVVGNHDRRDRLLEAFPETPADADGFVQAAVETSAGWFLMLDTVEQGKGWGSYCAGRRDWLRRSLADARGRPVYLFMHHCIGEVLSVHDNVRHLFFGHVHRPIAGSWRGIPYSTLRGTNHQVPLDFDAVEVVPKSHEPPAYALVFLEDDQTTVHFHDYLDTYRVPYDKRSEGRPDWG